MRPLLGPGNVCCELLPREKRIVPSFAHPWHTSRRRFTEEVIRPGDTVHVAGVVRKTADGAMELVAMDPQHRLGQGCTCRWYAPLFPMKLPPALYVFKVPHQPQAPASGDQMHALPDVEKPADPGLEPMDAGWNDFSQTIDFRREMLKTVRTSSIIVAVFLVCTPTPNAPVRDLPRRLSGGRTPRPLRPERLAAVVAPAQRGPTQHRPSALGASRGFIHASAGA